MTDDQHGEGRPPQGGGRWDPLPQGDYDDGATAFVKLPEGGIDALLAADSPLAAPGHGYVPPQITAAPPATDGTWAAPAGGTEWPAPQLPPETSGGDRFTYNPGSTGQWSFTDTSADPAGPAAPAPGHDVTGQWSIPVAGGDLPDESGEFTTSALVEQWGGTPPATLPGGAAAPWATGSTNGAGQNWAQQAQQPGVAEAGHTGVQETGRPAPDTSGFGHPAERGAPHETGHDTAYGLSNDTAHDAGHTPAYGTSHTPGHEVGHPPTHRPDHTPAPHGTDHTPAPHGDHTPAHGTDHTPPHGVDPTSAHGVDHAPAHGVDHAPADSAPPARPAAEPWPGGDPADAGPAAPAEEAVEALEDASEAEGADGAPGGTRDAHEPADGAQGPAEAAAGHDAPSDREAGRPGSTDPAGHARGETDDEASEDDVPPPPAEEHPLASYVLRVNGSDRPVTDAWIGESLLYVLRERLGLAGAKDGCSQGECGACNVQVDGRLVASCLVPAVTTAGSEVRTVEGLAVDGQPSDVQRALARCGAVQCGFCVPGMAMTVHDLLEGNPAPTELEARQALCGNLCRCSGYKGVLRAVKDVVAEREARTEAESDGDEARIPHQAGPGAGGVHPSAFENPAQPHPHDPVYGQGQDGGQT
ncbi:2Fe-2S iron-sulfur cluster-binding protein [Streptomyces sp. NBC_00582]|uniref:2Fe-2S iron-sulfur cluster-binding protein n=1 Tax=Streptomyces sp. NBC_00582 TaxID=2975783 RepID=UPI002E7FEB9E|nr:2Fe-2S iron-sulfur cluster-binding protein [Streptomyces sp. NBC_00582]WUB64248.1 2Fe-2S iron-sulfur cluster-binding protein [Streptomyces sp. NBC_00582]